MQQLTLAQKKQALILKGAAIREQLKQDLVASRKTVRFAESSWHTFLFNRKVGAAVAILGRLIPNQRIKKTLRLSLRLILVGQLVNKYLTYRKS